MQSHSQAKVVQLINNPKVATLSFILGGGMRAEVRFLGSDLGPSHIAMLQDYLGITSKALASRPSSPESEATP